MDDSDKIWTDNLNRQVGQKYEMNVMRCIQYSLSSALDQM